MAIAVISDIVGSRKLSDRAGAQRAIDDTFAAVERAWPRAREPFRPTAGDEQQAVYATLEDALGALLLVQLALPDGIACRFGVGIGPIEAVPSSSGEVPEGPGWWAARVAIDHVRTLQRRAAPRARTWVAAADAETDAVRAAVPMTNAYLLSRDQVVAAMTPRQRRLTYGRCLGRPQADLAQAEGVSQSAVSQGLSAAGAPALIEGFHALTGTRA